MWVAGPRPVNRAAPERAHRGENLDVLAHRLGLARDEFLDRLAKARIGDPVQTMGALRQVPPRQLVLALRAGFDPREPAGDREIAGLVVAQLEMQERVVLGLAPVAAEERVTADEIERAGDGLAVAHRASTSNTSSRISSWTMSKKARVR